MFRRLSLRLRILLFFLFLGLGSIAITLGALVLSYARLADLPYSPDVLSAFINAGAISGFGILGLGVFVWLLFDENVAKPIERLAAGMRARAHANVRSGLDEETAKYLGDLAPAAAAMTQRLSVANIETAEMIAEKTAQLEAEKARLTSILSDIPVAVLLVGANHRITLYDGQCAAVLGHAVPLGLGHSIFEYVEKEPLLGAYESLRGAPAPQVSDLPLPTIGGSRMLNTTLRILGADGGYMMAIEIEDKVIAQRPLVFDFDLLNRETPDTLETAKLRDLAYVVFDTETTGLNTKTDDVVQIGALRVVNCKRIHGEVLDTYVDPKRPIPPASTDVHGITDAMVEGAPTFDVAGRDFHRFARDAVLVAHNAPFDMAFFKRHEAEIGRTFDFPVLDTVLLSAAVFGESATHTLDALAANLDVSLDDAVRHTAMGDAVATAEVLLGLIPILESKGIRTFGDAVEAMRQHQRLLPDLN
ncbi:MAG: 3'-5' exonuclease [Pseudomonadota bacterium]